MTFEFLMRSMKIVEQFYGKLKNCSFHFVLSHKVYSIGEVKKPIQTCQLKHFERQNRHLEILITAIPIKEKKELASIN